MYALKLELKLNNKERSLLAGCAGFKRVVYNFLPGLGEFRLKEKLRSTCSSQTTISRQANRWFVSFVLDVERVPPLFHEVVEPTGIDLGIKCFATLSDGTMYAAPKPLKKAKTKLAKLQWRNRNKQLGNKRLGVRASNNARKFYLRQAVLHADVTNQRQDYLQKTTTEISQKYAHVKIEDLNIKGMIANHKLSSAISDLGFYEFRRMLEYKQSFYSCRVELVERWFPSSKTCSSCGWVKEKLSLSERIFDCCSCGIVLDRDLNAAVNLAKYVPGATRELMPVDEKEPTPSATSFKRRSRK
jgi:putative transposase